MQEDEELIIRRLERQYDNVTRTLSRAHADLTTLRAEGPTNEALLGQMHQKVAALRAKRDQLRRALNEFV